MSLALLTNPARQTDTELAPYKQMGATELAARIAFAKRQLGQRLLILGHHYQQDDVIAFADQRGDSLKLSQWAAQSKTADFIIFCGVHFMAETADILTEPTVQVILPDLAAGCSMADMADIDQVESAWEELADVIDVEDLTPVTYINSAASLKAFCGNHGGAVCTSTNARRVLEWAFSQRSKVFFFPDQHLGRNTAKRMGIPLDQMVVWDPAKPLGGAEAQRVRNA
jgi:quinolinate synthase